MRGQRIGYVRVSSFDQNPERQLDQVQVDKLFTDKASGKDTQRPQLDALLSFAREGDTVVVHSMDRLARNLDDLRRLVQTLTKRGIRIEFVKEGANRENGKNRALGKSDRFEPRAQQTAGRVLLEAACLLDVALHRPIMAPAALLLDVAEVGAGAVRAGGHAAPQAVTRQV